MVYDNNQSQQQLNGIVNNQAQQTANQQYQPMGYRNVNYNQLVYGQNAYPYYNQYMYPNSFANQSLGNNMVGTQNQMPSQNNTQNNQPIIWIQGEAGAKAYPVRAGNTVMLMDSEASVFYIKTTDMNGVPMPLRVFDYRERSQQNTIPQNAILEQDNINNSQQQQQQQYQLNNVEKEMYITRKEFEERMSSIENNFNSIRGQKNESFVQSSGRQQNAKPTKQSTKHDATVQ